MNPEHVQVNANIGLDDLTKLKIMMEEDMLLSRSNFVRKLIRQEWERRHQPVKLILDNADDSQDMNSLSD